MAARKKYTLVVDGETYEVQKPTAFDQLGLDQLGTKVMGSCFRVAAKSRNMIDAIGSLLKELAPKIDDTEELRKVLDSGVAKFVHSTLFESEDGKAVIENSMVLLGALADEIAERLTHKDLEKAVNLALVGNLWTSWGGSDEADATLAKSKTKVHIDTAETYSDMMSDRMDKHGSMHQLKLLWGAVKLSLGPTIAGVFTGLLQGGTSESAK